MLPESCTCVDTIENWELSLEQTALHTRSFILSSHLQVFVIDLYSLNLSIL